MEMAKNRHSFVALYTSDWIAGTARMPRLMKSVYHDICLFNWDKNQHCSAVELEIMLSDLPQAQGDGIVQALITSGRLVRNEDGGVFSPRAMIEAGKAFELWEKKSRGGKMARLLQDSSQDSLQHSSTEPEPTPELPTEVKKVGAKAPTKEMAEAYSRIFDAWNTMAETTGPAPDGLPRVQRLTDARRASLKARIGEHGIDAIVSAIATIPDSDFLMGRSGGRWKANLDDLMSPKNCAKLIEGGYAQGAGKRSSWR